ncbi:MAG: S49 family peptidase [Rhodobacteraceae bacterium]|nr:S49 family peptidase [Paracoccaceae bacterium]
MRHLIPFIRRPAVVPLIRLQGMIAQSGRLGGVLNDAGIGPVIDRAFGRGRPAAVALVVNSPGGSPAQSSLIAARVRRLAAEKGLRVHAFVEDVAASGGYWLACAADDIWLDETSVVGSVGVISAGFGFHDLIARHGVERRVHTAGASKGQLDPFRPEQPEDVARLEALLAQLHETFKAQVTARRGARLAQGTDLFTGEVWIGRKAVELGLADGIAHAVPKLKELYGDGVKIVPMGPKKGLFRRFGSEIVEGSLAAVEERALWARYGL